MGWLLVEVGRLMLALMLMLVLVLVGMRMARVARFSLNKIIAG